MKNAATRSRPSAPAVKRVDLSEIAWEQACALAKCGQAKELIAMLRDPKTHITPSARRFMADLVASCARGLPIIRNRRGTKARLEERDLSRIRLIIGHARRVGYSRAVIGALVHRLAESYSVTAATIRDAACATRKRYRVQIPTKGRTA